MNRNRIVLFFLPVGSPVASFVVLAALFYHRKIPNTLRGEKGEPLIQACLPADVGNAASGILVTNGCA